jgi:hypothetical protein
LVPGWVVVDGPPINHRYSVGAPASSGAFVHGHGFAIEAHLHDRPLVAPPGPAATVDPLAIPPLSAATR